MPAPPSGAEAEGAGETAALVPATDVLFAQVLAATVPASPAVAPQDVPVTAPPPLAAETAQPGAVPVKTAPAGDEDPPSEVPAADLDRIDPPQLPPESAALGAFLVWQAETMVPPLAPQPQAVASLPPAPTEAAPTAPLVPSAPKPLAIPAGPQAQPLSEAAPPALPVRNLPPTRRRCPPLPRFRTPAPLRQIARLHPWRRPGRGSCGLASAIGAQARHRQGSFAPDGNRHHAGPSQPRRDEIHLLGQPRPR